MVTTILGRKIGMTQVWDENDNIVPVTVIQAGPCTVSQVKTKATDGYDAVQIGFGDIKAKHVNKPLAGHFKAHNVEPARYLAEVRVENGEDHKCGDVVTVKDFADVAAVDVIGTSKGKGFQGTSLVVLKLMVHATSASRVPLVSAHILHVFVKDCTWLVTWAMSV